MKELVLHVGTAKTGTTALQYFLQDNAKRLEEQGWRFPPTVARYAHVAANRNGHFLYRMATGSVLHDGDRDLTDAKNQANLDAFAQALQEGERFILSDEMLWNINLKKAGALHAIKELLEGMGAAKVKVRVYLRRQDEYAISLWKQRVKGTGRMSITASKFIGTRLWRRAMDYDAILRDYESVFGRENVEVRVFDRSSLIGNDVRLDFCEWLGIDVTPDFTFRDAQSNESLSNNAAEIKRIANTVESYLETDNFLRTSALEVSRISPEIGNQTPVPPAKLAAMLEKHAEGNSRIAREYLGNVDGKLFSPPQSLPEEWTRGGASFEDDVIRFFVDALVREREERLALEREMKALKERVSREGSGFNLRFEKLGKRMDGINAGLGILARIRRRLWRKRQQRHDTTSAT